MKNENRISGKKRQNKDILKFLKVKLKKIKQRKRKFYYIYDFHHKAYERSTYPIWNC